jgi:hypothetical protein
MRYFFCLLLSVFSLTNVSAQRPKQQVFLSDIDNFWVAYDSLRTTTDSARQVAIFTRLYLAKGTPGLRAFQEVKGYEAAEWVGSIRQHPKFWRSIRPATQLAKTGASNLEPYLAKFKKLYPALRPASIYFTIGALRSGGTTQDSMVLVGAELAAGNSQTDISEFTGSTHTFLARHFTSNPFANITLLNVHEYAHTQEHGPGNTVLGQALYEGTCELVAELVTGKKILLPYMTYGPAHKEELKEQFKNEIFTPLITQWFYNQTSAKPSQVPDLGYYMGYTIEKFYYQHATNKQQVIRELLELDYTNDQAVEAFLAKTHYYAQPVDKAALLQAYESRRPTVTRIFPTPSADGLLDASVREIRVEFSVPMSRFTATDYGSGGKAAYPVVTQPGFSADKRSYTYQVALKPGQTYSWVLNGGGFSDENGYPLKRYEVKFRTRQ